MNRKGVTLLEMIVYIAISAIASLIVWSLMNKTLDKYSSGKRMSVLQSDSRDVLSMIAREIKNMGFKNYVTVTGTNTLSMNVAQKAYLADLSSFTHKEGNPGDTITWYAGVVDNQGAFTTIDSIRYFLSGTTLKRTNLKTNATTDLAENVFALQFQYGIFDADLQLVNENPVNPANWRVQGCTQGGAAGAMLISAAGAQINDSICCKTLFSIVDTERVKVRFAITAQNGFPGNIDSAKWVLRRPSGIVIAQERFLARTSSNDTVDIILPSAKEPSATVACVFTCHGAGSLVFKAVQVRRVDLGKYVWTFNPDATQKQHVKAIKIFLLTRSSGTTNIRNTAPITVGTITVAPSGNYAWRLLTETVEVPNNGLF